MRGALRDTNRIRVFIGHTPDMNRYPADRTFVQAAADAIRLSGHIAIFMDDFTAVSSQPASYYQQQVRRCDVYVGVIGFRYGSLVTEGLHGDDGAVTPAVGASRGVSPEVVVADRRDVSYTELEFLTAAESGIPRLLFLLHEETLIPRSLTDRSLELVEAFRERLRSAGVTVGSFRTADSLEAQVMRALIWLRYPDAVKPDSVAEPPADIVDAPPWPGLPMPNGFRPVDPAVAVDPPPRSDPVGHGSVDVGAAPDGTLPNRYGMQDKAPKKDRRRTFADIAHAALHTLRVTPPRPPARRILQAASDARWNRIEGHFDRRLTRAGPPPDEHRQFPSASQPEDPR